MSAPLVPARFLFRFSAPCRYRKAGWTAKGAKLDVKYRLPNLAELEGRKLLADVRLAWNEAGLLLAVDVSGKKQPPWCRINRPEESDGLQLWIDTRDVHSVHRANRFCHRFLLTPAGAGPLGDQPVIQWLPINRAREHPAAIAENLLKVRSQNRPDGYLLEALIPREALTGFDPGEDLRLGFNYAVIDRELGEQTLGVGHPMPYREDPSLWVSLELTK